jgi:cellulose biosynthesis protein BcsQ
VGSVNAKERRNRHTCWAKSCDRKRTEFQESGELAARPVNGEPHAACRFEGRRTLVVDMDRQASAFDWSAARNERSALGGLTVVKADKAIALPRFREIARGYDCVFLDGPPRGDITQSAAVADDVAVFPIQSGSFDFGAVAETLATSSGAEPAGNDIRRVWRALKGRKPA